MNPFHDAGLFLYPLITSENQRISHILRGYKKRLMTWNWLIGDSNTGKNTPAKFLTSKREILILYTPNKKHLSDLFA